MIKVANKKDRNEYLALHMESNGAYFIVRYDGTTELLWFTKHEKWNADGTDWYLEAPNELSKIAAPPEKYIEDYLKLGYVMYEGDAYVIETPQVSPFLPEVIEIEYLGDAEEDAVKYLINAKQMEA